MNYEHLIFVLIGILKNNNLTQEQKANLIIELGIKLKILDKKSKNTSKGLDD